MPLVLDLNIPICIHKVHKNAQEMIVIHMIHLFFNLIVMILQYQKHNGGSNLLDRKTSASSMPPSMKTHTIDKPKKPLKKVLKTVVDYPLFGSCFNS